MRQSPAGHLPGPMAARLGKSTSPSFAPEWTDGLSRVNGASPVARSGRESETFRMNTSRHGRVRQPGTDVLVGIRELRKCQRSIRKAHLVVDDASVLDQKRMGHP